MRILIMAMLVAACGGGDECERFFDKTKPIFEKAMKERGKSLSDADKTKFLEECRKAKKEGKTGDDAMMKCVLEASSEAAVAKCMEEPFGSYMKKAKKSEAELQLNKIAKNAKVHYMTEAQFPIGKSATPMDTCCGQPQHKCPVMSASQWAADPVWEKLDFMVDEPTLFRYSYESTDGKSFVARAVGDLDCDANMVTFEAKGTVAEGNPIVEIHKPEAID